MPNPATLDAVEELRRTLGSVALPLEALGAAEARAAKAELVGQIDDYLLPRLREIDAPLLVVVGGSTGAGKSTILNSLVGREVSRAGVIRPTTTTPILVSNPADLSWFESERLLPGLPRLTGSYRSGEHGLFLLPDDDVPRGLALLDAPDIDSVVETNRELGAQLLAAADLWLFVTTAARYSDAVPWGFLKKARERATSLALVLNRVPPEALADVPSHLSELLRREGLEGTPVLTIPEADLSDGLIQARHLEPVRTWLDRLAADAGARHDVVRKTLDGVLRSLPERVEVVAEQIETQIAAAESLAREAEAAYAVALTEIEEGLSNGPLLRGEVLSRWHEFIGTGDFMRQVQTSISRMRDRVKNVLLGKPPVTEEVSAAVEQSIATVVVAACDKAVDRLLEAWRAAPAGRALIATDEVPRSTSPELAETLERALHEWQGYVLELVSAEGASKRAAGRFVSFSVNGLATALMIVSFAHTGGLTGGEVVIAGGAAAVSQRLLEALFGDQAVRDLTAKARADLLLRLTEIVGTERSRFAALATEAADDATAATDIRTAVARIQQAQG